MYLASSYNIPDNFTSTNIEITHMGIGSDQILHGYPDARIRARSSEMHVIVPSGITNPDESPASDGDSIIVEGKWSMLHSIYTS